jgi:hypothetical protein
VGATVATSLADYNRASEHPSVYVIKPIKTTIRDKAAPCPRDAYSLP